MVVCTGIFIWLAMVVGVAAARVEPPLTDLLQQVPDWSTVDLQFRASIKRRDLQNSGLHRILMTDVHWYAPVDRTGPTDAHPVSWRSLPVAVVENITQDVYVDLDEVASLAEFGGPQVIASAYMDTEKPAAVSSVHTVLVYSRLQDHRATVELPLHFRYQAPSDSLYKVVLVPAPRVLVQCRHQQDEIATHLPTCTKGKDASVLKLPCDATTAEYCYWTPVKTNAGANTLQVDIPCGLKDHTTLVVVGTVSMTIFGTLYLTYVAASVVIS